MLITGSLRKEHELLNKELLGKKAKKELLEQRKETLQKEIDSYKVEELEMRGVVLQKMAEKQRTAACKKLEYLGTCALQYAISPTYRMKVDILPGKRPTAEVVICKRNGIEIDPSEGGGGVIDISSMALRIISLESYEPFVDGPIILDEPGKMVSKEYVPMLSEFIKKISKDFGRQVIVVTHNEFLGQVADTKIRVTLDEQSNISSVQVE